MMEKKLKLKRRIGLEALIEEVEGMQNIDSIARSSDRLECLIFGMGDFSASMGISLEAAIGETGGYPGDMWHYARFRLVMACRAAGIDPVDGPFANFRDETRLPRGMPPRSCSWAASANGRFIRPRSRSRSKLFSPDPKKLATARKVVAEYARAESQGLGAITYDGMMVDVATVRVLRNGILQRGDLYGMTGQDADPAGSSVA